MTDFAETSARTLDRLAAGETVTILDVEPPSSSPEWGRWLDEIGFIAGERATVMARAVPGGDPLAVRVGQSTFALRRAEAACVRVAPAPELSAIPGTAVEFPAGSTA